MQVNYHKIPDEMKHFHQWLVWRYEDRGGAKPTKVPYNPLTKKLTSVTDQSTWCSFQEAVDGVAGYDGIGFVLSKHDPYTFVDLDDTEGDATKFARQHKIHQEFDSYSELSPSGKGLHIICKGHIPNGRRRQCVELYSDERYMTMTGNVFHDKPIMERQEMVHMLWSQMGGGASVNLYTGEAEETMTDEQVIERGLNALNGDKFKALLEGNWQGYYPSQSEADLAFIDIVAFYTQSAGQIARLFLGSPLGQRDKAKRPDYVNKMILRSFDRMLPPVDFSLLMDKTESSKEHLQLLSGVNPSKVSPESINEAQSAMLALKAFHTPTPVTPPRGLLGEIARFIYDSSPRPVAEIALASAIGLMAGICGRAYNVSGTGLNMYLLLLAATGTGKEAIASGYAKLMSSVAQIVPAATEFRGPAELASGQAVLKHISQPNQRCFVSIVGEFGLKMQQLSSGRASSSEIMLKRVLLDLYNKSGKNDIVAQSVYADKDKNSAIVKSPAVSILGESTPETFYAALDEGLITDGLLPRFMFIEYDGPRPRRNKNHASILPSMPLVERVAELCNYALTMHRIDEVLTVGMTKEAQDFLDQVDELVDDTINATKTDVLRHLWNRAHIKTLKLAGIVAVGVNYVEPVIELEDAKWALNMVLRDIMSIVSRFTRGEIGKNNDENQQGNGVIKACAEYLTRSYKDLGSYVTIKELHADKVIPAAYLQRKLSSMAAFKNDKLGPREALKRTIQGLLDGGDLQEVGKNVLLSKYKFSGRAFIIPEPEKIPLSFD